MLRAVVASLAALLLLVGCGSQSAKPVTVELEIGAEAPAEPQRIEVPLGAEVTLTGTSQITDVLHVHGYEREIDLVSGESYEDVFTADMAGVYEIETHDVLAVWATLVVR